MTTRNSGTDETGVEGAGKGDVRGALDDGATVGEDGEGVRAAAKTEEEIVGAEVLNVCVTGEAGAETGEVYGAAMLVDLHGVSSAEGDVSAVLAGEVSKDALAADFAIWAGGAGGDFGVVQIAVVCRGAEARGVPEVEGEEGAAHEMRLAGEELEGFGDLDGGGEIDGSGEDPGGVACFDVAGGRLGEDAGEAGGGRNSGQ